MPVPGRVLLARAEVLMLQNYEIGYVTAGAVELRTEWLGSRRDASVQGHTLISHRMLSFLTSACVNA